MRKFLGSIWTALIGQLKSTSGALTLDAVDWAKWARLAILFGLALVPVVVVYRAIPAPVFLVLVAALLFYLGQRWLADHQG